jgi:hypothetical protein
MPHYDSTCAHVGKEEEGIYLINVASPPLARFTLELFYLYTPRPILHQVMRRHSLPSLTKPQLGITFIGVHTMNCVKVKACDIIL